MSEIPKKKQLKITISLNKKNVLFTHKYIGPLKDIGGSYEGHLNQSVIGIKS